MAAQYDHPRETEEPNIYGQGQVDEAVISKSTPVCRKHQAMEKSAGHYISD
jgi:hypothetical protein